MHVRGADIGTAFFVGSIDVPAGERTASATFTLPGNLGTWVVRAVAVQASAAATAHASSKRLPSGRGGGGGGGGKRLLYGQATSEIVARKEVNLLPSMPRIVRPGDHFGGGCTVTALSARVVTVQAQLAGTGWLELVGPSTSKVSVAADTPTEVLFEFVSHGMGEANVTFVAESAAETVHVQAGRGAGAGVARAAAGGAGAEPPSLLMMASPPASPAPSASDAFVVQLPLLGTQDSVTLSTSFAIDGAASASSAPWQEGIDFPEAVNGSGSVDLSVSVGHLAAIESVATTVERELAAEVKLYGYGWVDSVMAVLAPPLTRHAFGLPPGGANQTYAQSVKATLETLCSYTAGANGLQPAPPETLGYPPFASVYPNWFALYLFKQELSAHFYFPALEEVLAGSAIVQAAASWEQAATAAIYAGYVQVPRVWSWGDVVSMHFALGDRWTPPVPFNTDPKFQTLCSFASLLENVASLSVEQQAMVGLTVVWSNSTAAHAPLLKQLGTQWYV